MKELLEKIVNHPSLHAKWLNALSFMENQGARKISANEDESFTGILQLKHAAEEHRHAYYLKKQILKIAPEACVDYSDIHLLAAASTRNYLKKLDLLACLYLKKNVAKDLSQLKYVAYLLVTYAIELRADELYPVYQEVLNNKQVKVSVRSIIVEEEGHLEEMIQELDRYSTDWRKHAEEIQKIEQNLYASWIQAIEKDVDLLVDA